MTISICICTLDRPQRLRAALESLLRLEEPSVEWEIVVVDNGGGDGLEGVVAPYRVGAPLRLLREPRAGLSHARNRALAEASGRFVAYIDDDVTVPAEWLRAYADAFERWPRAGYFGGPIIPKLSDERYRREALALERVMPGVLSWLQPKLAEGRIPPEHSGIPWGANMAFRKAAVGERRFDPELGRGPAGADSGEETQLIRELQAAGWAGVWMPAAKVDHYIGPERFSRSYIARYCRGVGRRQGRAAALADALPPRKKRYLSNLVFCRRLLAYGLTPPWASPEERLTALRDFELVRGFRGGFRDAMMERSPG